MINFLDFVINVSVFVSDPDVIQDVIPQNVIEEEEKNIKRKLHKYCFLINSVNRYGIFINCFHRFIEKVYLFCKKIRTA